MDTPSLGYSPKKISNLCQKLMYFSCELNFLDLIGNFYEVDLQNLGF